MKPLTKPFYKDDYITIYNEDSRLATEADVIILDPPYPLDDVTKYKADAMFIFAGSKVEFYAEQLRPRKMYVANWGRRMRREEGGFCLAEEPILVVGNNIFVKLRTYQWQTAMETSWQRPTTLLIDLISSVGGDILDPFLGSGATAVAAKLLRRKCVGYDIEEGYCKIAARRCMEIKWK